ncbi:MAG: hypothetical protein ACOYB1_10155 [Limnohabitans sp.]
MDATQEQALARLVMRSASEIAEGKSKSDVIKQLESEGCSAELSQVIVNRGAEIKKQEFKKGGKTTILIGIGMLGLGTAITAGSYSAASGGGHYVITSGLFMVGAWLVIKGLWRSVAG